MAGSDHEATTLGPDSGVKPSTRHRQLVLTIAYHPDLTRIGEHAVLGGFRSASTVRLSRLVPAFARGSAEPRPLGGAHLSRRPVFIESTADGGVTLTWDDNIVQLEVDGVAAHDRHTLRWDDVSRGVLLELGGRVALVLHESGPADPGDDLGLVGVSERMGEVRKRIARVGPLDETVLVRGATGTGKELVARAIHASSQRKDGPFVSVNMAAIPSTMAAAALFGHARGAFTGATTASRGYFGSADGGTLFLDEIGDTPSEIQTAMLRAIEGGEIQPVGDDATRRVNVRLIAATDADLEGAVAEGRFRDALLQRLGGYVLALPPLRERRQDVGLLLVHFLRDELERLGKAELLHAPVGNARPWLPAWVVAGAVRAPWSGNVRQLKNAAKQLAIDWCGRAEIPRDRAVEALLDLDTGPRVEPARPAKRKVSDISDDDLMEALRNNAWQPANTAVALGISRTSLYALMKKSPHVRKAADLTREEVEAALRSAVGDVAQAANALCVSEQGLKRQMHDLGVS